MEKVTTGITVCKKKNKSLKNDDDKDLHCLYLPDNKVGKWERKRPQTHKDWQWIPWCSKQIESILIQATLNLDDKHIIKILI